MGEIAAVIFDLDGVLVDSEAVWNDVRRELTEEAGGRWRADAQRAMMGMSSPEWSRYMEAELGVPMPAGEISAAVVGRIQERYEYGVPLIDGARRAVEALAERWPLGLASSANRPIIELVLEESGLAPEFESVVSSEEVANGKPDPDVYLEAARRLGVDASACAATEDSSNGLRSAAAAQMSVVAIPNRDFPPDAGAISLADVVLDSISELKPPVIEGLG